MNLTKDRKKAITLDILLLKLISSDTKEDVLFQATRQSSHEHGISADGKTRRKNPCLMERKVEMDVLRCFVAFMDVPGKI